MIKKGCLDILQAKCENCTDCILSKTRHNVVFADGYPETAKIVLIGEAPGENEDETGKPFVGRAGQLLNKFLEDAGISRQDDLYIINKQYIIWKVRVVALDSPNKKVQLFVP